MANQTTSGIHDRDGLIGIGTISPSEILTVNGAGTFRTNANNFQTTSQFTVDYYDGNSAGRLAAYKSTGSNIIFFTNAASANTAEVMRIDSNGNVGIGYNSPITKLHIGTPGRPFTSTVDKSNGDMVGIVVAADTNENTMNGIWFSSGTDHSGTHWSGIAGSRSNYASDWSTHLAFFTHVNATSNITQATEKMRITGEGQVGIGTTDPTTYVSQLAIKTSLSRGVTVFDTGLSNSNVLYGLGFGYANSNYNSVYQGFYKVGDQSTSNFYTIGLYNQDYILNVAGTGNVGIGVTAPGTKLEVFSTAPSGDRTLPHNVLTITAEHGNAPYGHFGGAILFKNRSYVTGMVESARIRSVIYDDGAPNNFGGGIWLETTPTPGGTLTPSFVLNYQGRVGIGTTAPLQELHVKVTSGNADVRVEGPTSTNYTDFYRGDSAGGIYVYGDTDFKIGANSGGGSNMFVADVSSGNIGINIATPGAKLDVNSGISTSSTDVIKLTQATNGADKAAASLGLSIQNGGEATNAADLWFTTANGGSLVERMRITSGGTLRLNSYGAGNGTGTPAYHLAVNSSGYVIESNSFTGSLQGNITGTAASETLATVTGRGASTSTQVNFQGNVFLEKSSGNNILHITSAAGGTPVLYMTGPSRGWGQYVDVNDLHFKDETGNVVTMVLQAGGNVGIGTTGPRSKLHVAGAGNSNGGNILIGDGGSGANKWSYLTGAHYDQATGTGNGVGSAGIALIGSFANSTANEIHIGGAIYEANPATSISFYTHTSNLHATGGSEKMRITSVGNVGIGSAIPAALLDVAGTWKLGDVSGGSFKSYTYGTQLDVSGLTSGGWARAHKISTSDSSGHVFFGALGDNTTLSRAYWTIGDPSSIDTTGYNSSNGIVLLKNGYVGIGNTNPSHWLTVKKSGAANGTQQQVAQFANIATGATSAAIYIGALAGTDWLIGKNIYGVSSLYNFQIGDQGVSTSYFDIAPSGNVGIGTTGPVAKLDVYKSGSLAVNVAGSQGQLFSITDSLSGSLMSVNDISGIPILEVFSDDRVVMGTFGQDTLVVNGDRVGIGTQSPAYGLVVENPTTSQTGAMYVSAVLNSSGKGLVINSTTRTTADNAVLAFEIINRAGGNTMAATVAGNVGIGQTNPVYKLDVTGTIRATGDVIAYSDRRVKQDIVTLENSVELVKKLRGVSYKKIGEDDQKIGVIAQEILEVLPQVVSKDAEGMYSVAYGNMAGLFIEAIKEQQQHIETLEERIQKLEQLLTQKP